MHRILADDRLIRSLRGTLTCRLLSFSTSRIVPGYRLKLSNRHRHKHRHRPERDRWLRARTRGSSHSSTPFPGSLGSALALTMPS